MPETLKNVGFMIKDAKRVPDTNGWGSAQFNYDVGSGTCAKVNAVRTIPRSTIELVDSISSLEQ